MTFKLAAKWLGAAHIRPFEQSFGNFSDTLLDNHRKRGELALRLGRDQKLRRRRGAEATRAGRKRRDVVAGDCGLVLTKNDTRPIRSAGFFCGAVVACLVRGTQEGRDTSQGFVGVAAGMTHSSVRRLVT